MAVFPMQNVSGFHYCDSLILKKKRGDPVETLFFLIQFKKKYMDTRGKKLNQTG